MATSRGMFALSNKETEKDTAIDADPENLGELLSTTFSENQLYVLGAASALGLGFLGCYFMFRTKEYPTTLATKITVPLNDGRRMPLLSMGFKKELDEILEFLPVIINCLISSLYIKIKYFYIITNKFI